MVVRIATPTSYLIRGESPVYLLSIMLIVIITQYDTERGGHTYLRCGREEKTHFENARLQKHAFDVIVDSPL